MSSHVYFVTNEQNLLTCLQLLYVNKKVSVICYIYLYTIQAKFVFEKDKPKKKVFKVQTNVCKTKKLHQEALLLLTVKVTPEIPVRIYQNTWSGPALNQLWIRNPAFLYA